MRELTLIAHDIRSCHNVGALLRTAEGLKVSVYLTGYTPYPALANDQRLPHISAKLTRQIHKTALGAEKTAKWQFEPDVRELLKSLKQDGFHLVALEQASQSLPLHEYKAPDKVALLIGREREGIKPSLLKFCEQAIEIPMLGKKESYNVVHAAAMTLFYLRFVT